MLTAANRTARRAARSRRDTERRAAPAAPAEREQPRWISPTAERALEMQSRLSEFMDEHVYPAEPVYARAAPRGRPALPAAGHRGAEGRGARARPLEPVPAGRALRRRPHEPRVRAAGGDHRPQLDIAPEALNCAAPDTGNMEILAEFGTPEQQERLARAAARGRDPLVLRDDRAGGRELATPPTWQTRIERDGDEYVINGRKWWTSGAMDARCKIAIFMGVTDPDADPLPPAQHDPRAARHARA